jgi:hypothetical protein
MPSNAVERCCCHRTPPPPPSLNAIEHHLYRPPLPQLPSMIAAVKYQPSPSSIAAVKH